MCCFQMPAFWVASCSRLAAGEKMCHLPADDPICVAANVDDHLRLFEVTVVTKRHKKRPSQTRHATPRKGTINNVIAAARSGRDRARSVRRRGARASSRAAPRSRGARARSRRGGVPSRRRKRARRFKARARDERRAKEEGEKGAARRDADAGSRERESADAVAADRERGRWWRRRRDGASPPDDGDDDDGDGGGGGGDGGGNGTTTATNGEANPHVVLARTPCGGHCAFFEGRCRSGSGPDRSVGGPL